MNKKLYLLIAAPLLLIVILVGFFLPLGSYETTKGCPTDTEIRTVRLHLIFGETLQAVKDRDTRSVSPNEGCSVNANYVLYLL